MSGRTYYAVVSGTRTAANPAGLVRRVVVEAEVLDESLRRDLSWGPTSAIAEWQRDAMDFDLVEVSETAADRLVDEFRAAWSPQD